MPRIELGGAKPQLNSCPSFQVLWKARWYMQVTQVGLHKISDRNKLLILCPLPWVPPPVFVLSPPWHFPWVNDWCVRSELSLKVDEKSWDVKQDWVPAVRRDLLTHKMSFAFSTTLLCDDEVQSLEVILNRVTETVEISDNQHLNTVIQESFWLAIRSVKEVIIRPVKKSPYHLIQTICTP